MDDLNEKLAELLGDPDTMNRVRKMAESILGGEEQAPPSPPKAEPENIGMPSGDEIKAIMSVMSHLKSGENDSRVQLIAALKPHLSEERRERADSAIKILKIIEILPLIKESGLLKL